MVSYTCHRPHLDTITDWADPPLFTADAVPTGIRTNRGVRVYRLEVWVVETTDAYEPTRLDTYPDQVEAVAAAEETLSEPDSRGVMREWTVKRA
jgi:hypothetical protein